MYFDFTFERSFKDHEPIEEYRMILIRRKRLIFMKLKF